MKFDETGAIRNVRTSLIIGRAVSWEALSSMKNNRYLLAAASLYALSPPNHSLKLTERTACFYAARKKLFREMATRSARIASDDQAVRRRSLAPVR